MKSFLMCLFFACSLMFASCQSDQNNQNTEESRGDGINDEIGGPEDGVNSDVQGEEQIGGEAIGTEEDTTAMQMEADSSEMQQQDEFQ